MQDKFEELGRKKIHEVRSMLLQVGASFARTETKQELINRYVELTMAVQPSYVNEEPVIMVDPPKPIESNVFDAIKDLYMKKHVEFTQDDVSWTATRGRLSVSGSLTLPERLIIQSLEGIMK